jgi:hypothetical protein
MAHFDLKQFARWGAEVRARQLELELAAIYKAFPELRRKPRYTDDGQTVNPAGRQRRRRKMGPAERRAVSLRMKRYWAARRKEKAQG